MSVTCAWVRLCWPQPVTLALVGSAWVMPRQAQAAKLSAEVAQQRPIWEKSKQLEDLHRAEVAEVSKRAFCYRNTETGE